MSVVKFDIYNDNCSDNKNNSYDNNGDGKMETVIQTFIVRIGEMPKWLIIQYMDIITELRL